MKDFLQDLPEITARISYVDTLQIWTAAPLSPEQLTDLRGQCGKVSVFSDTLRNRPDLRRRYLIQQPSAGALEFLRLVASYVHLINRIDVALDLVVADVGAVQELDACIGRYLTQRWHGKRRMTVYGGTTYISRDRRTNRNLVRYCDMPSKTTGCPCLNLELRFKGADACRRAGFEFLEHLLEMDHRKLWSEELCLRAMNPDKLERHIDEEAGRVLLRQPQTAVWWQRSMGGLITKREAMRRHLSAILAAALWVDGGPEINAETLHLALVQRWIEVSPKLARRCLVPIHSTQFLPDNSRHLP